MLVHVPDVAGGELDVGGRNGKRQRLVMSFACFNLVLRGPGGKVEPTALSRVDVSSSVSARIKVFCSLQKVNVLQFSQKLQPIWYSRNSWALAMGVACRFSQTR
jgi:hypothetical protein